MPLLRVKLLGTRSVRNNSEPGEMPYVNFMTPVTMCSDVTYTLTFAARQSNATKTECILNAGLGRYGRSFIEQFGSFRSDWTPYGPFECAIQYPQPARDGNYQQNSDGTYNDVFGISVECLGSDTPPDYNVLFEIDNVVNNVA